MPERNVGQRRPGLGQVILGAHGMSGAEGLGEAAVGATAGLIIVAAAGRGQDDHKAEAGPALDPRGDPLDLGGTAGHGAFGCGTRYGPSASASIEERRNVSMACAGVVTIGSPMLNDVLRIIGKEVLRSNSRMTSA